MLSLVHAIRYVTPLREGGSLPGIVEADDLGTYVVKFRGAGQGPKVLVAEVIVGELARRLGLRVPDLVRVELDPVIGRSEPDEEVQDLLHASGGLNLGMDFLPGSVGFDPVAWQPDGETAARVLWLDAFTSNVDRTWRNPNLLVWHDRLWLIDHGAALWFHHAWQAAKAAAVRPYDASDHVLAPTAAGHMEEADKALAPLVTSQLLGEVTALVPDDWLVPSEAEVALGLDSADALREAYATHLLDRLANRQAWLPAVDAA
ncbi:HipA family kinase [Yinghuangia seranimata]|uniref:HipA family kinase n=1 Tax=Yinghuangia seranimata TaxID=408067 RepID=UPI00248BAFF5|nr:HipA family kinase [Yinghuangia seranimata]MDI2124930.1 aminotransferase class I and II [Yinghuangia seranimata]